VVHILHRRHVDGEGTGILLGCELRNKSAKIDFSLADADLQFVFRRISEMYVIDVRNDLVERPALMRTVNEMARIECQTEPLHLIAKNDRRVRVLRHTSGLRLERNESAFEIGDPDHFAQSFNLLVEGRPKLSRRNDNRYDLCRLGQLATGSELLVIRITCRSNVNAQGRHGQALRRSKLFDRSRKMLDHLGRPERPTRFMNCHFDPRKTKIYKYRANIRQRHFGKTLGSCTDYHAFFPPMARIVSGTGYSAFGQDCPLT
jgi:hypothetical protein